MSCQVCSLLEMIHNCISFCCKIEVSSWHSGVRSHFPTTPCDCEGWRMVGDRAWGWDGGYPPPPSTHYIVGLIKGREVFSGCSDQVPGTTEIKIDASTNVHVSTKSRWESWMNNQNDGWLYIGHCLLLKQQGVYTPGPHHVFSFSLLSLGKSMVRIPELLLVFS